MYNDEIERNIDETGLNEECGVFGICTGCFDGNYPMEPPTEDIRGDFDK